MAYPGFGRQSDALGPMEFRQNSPQEEAERFYKYRPESTFDFSKSAGSGGIGKYTGSPWQDLAQFGGMAGASAVGQGLAEASTRRRVAEAERANLLNQQNDYRKFLAQRMAMDPTRSLRTYEAALNRAGRLRQGRGTGIGMGPGGPTVTGQVPMSPEMERLARSYSDLSRNLLEEDPSGILQFKPPTFEQVVSKSLADRGDFSNYYQGGVERGFGTRGGRPRGGGRGGGGGFGGFLQQALPFGAAAAGSALGLPPPVTGAIAGALPGILSLFNQGGSRPRRRFSGAGSLPRHLLGLDSADR